MSHINSSRRIPAAAAVMLACLGLAACGGSSKSSSTSASAAATTPAGTTSTGTTGPGTTGPGTTGPGAARLKALRECLQKNGITLPNPSGALGQQLPKGVTRAQYEAALKKCGGGAGGLAKPGAGIKSPVFQQALAKFAGCMRENGVNVPPPNTTGNGPIFNTKGLNTAGAQFRAAETKCSSDLRSAFQRGQGTGTAPKGGAAPGGPATG